jgi:hypothetical protein
VKNIILQNECPECGKSAETLFTTTQDILTSKRDKNRTPLHRLVHSLNPKYYSNDWLNGEPSRRFPTHMDGQISQGRKDAFRRIYQDRASLDEVEEGFVAFSTSTRRFGSYDVLRDKWVVMSPFG